MNLDQLQPGARARVLAVGGEPVLQQRMLELGILPGVEVKLVRKAPLGDPVEIELLGYKLSLRIAEARQVAIEALAAK